MGAEQALQNLQQGTRGANGETLDWSYYDRAVLAAATLVHSLFQTPRGQGAKTLGDTNMVSAGQIPQGQHFTIHAIKLIYVTNNALVTADIQTFYSALANTTLEFLIPGKDSMGTWLLSEILGTALLTAMTPTAAGDNIPLIQPRFHGVFPLNTPLVLAATTPFEVRLTHHVAVGAALADDRIFISLNGKLKRLS